MTRAKVFLILSLVILSLLIFPAAAQRGQSLTEADMDNTAESPGFPDETKVPDTPVSSSQGDADVESKDLGKPDAAESPANPGSGKTDYTSALPEFPRMLTVLDAGEMEAVTVRQKPSQDSKAVGVVYGSLIHVDVLQDEVDGYVKVSARDYNSGRLVEGYILKKYIKQVPTNPKYGVVVDTGDQRVYVYKDNALFKTFLCSTGLDGGYETPEGIYMIGSRGPSFYNPKYGQGAYNWVRFNKGYLFHSLPFDKDKNIIASEVDKLGTKASHGCVRLSMDDAKWFYDNIPRGTAVIVQK